MSIYPSIYLSTNREFLMWGGTREIHTYLSVDPFIDLQIEDIPEIACDKNDTGENIIARIPLRKGTSDFYTHQYLELSLINRYFFPTNLDKLTFNLSVSLSGFVVIELTYLNEQIHKD